jgi:G3E family GTPase
MIEAVAGMSKSSPDPLASRLPVTVITGFLGSGKTTLLRRLLHHPGMNRAAVIINEFGETGLDHELVEASTEQVTLLSNGCVCCTVRTDLQETLRDLFVKRRNGEVIDFDRVFVETTGMADPAPVVHALQSDGLLGAQFRLNGVVTLVDAVNGMASLDTMPEAAKQAALADRLVLTKTDIAKNSDVEALRERLRVMNPYALLSEAVDGVLDPELLRDIAPGNVEALARNPDRWLTADSLRAIQERSTSPLTQRFAQGGVHDAAIRSFCLWFDAPFDRDALFETLQVLTALRGPDLLRVKGIVNVHGESAPLAIHGVQHIFHPPLRLSRWNDDDRRSRIVFIVRAIPQETIERLFAAIGGLAK